MLGKMFWADLHLDFLSVCLLTVWMIICMAYLWFSLYYNNAIYKARKKTGNVCANHAVERAPFISVVIALNGQRNVLSENLPAILDQEYPNFEVIVIDDGVSEEHAVTLQQLQQHYHMLRVSMLPKSTLYISRKKLSITLGVRAAKGEWILLTEPDSAPNSPHWLMNMASKMNSDKDLVVGYSNYEDDSTCFCRRIRFERFMMQSVYARSILSGRPLGADGCNLAFRREAFLRGKGFSGNVSLLRGEDVFLVDTFSKPGNVAYIYDKVAAIEQKVCSKKSWKNEKISRMQACRFLKARSRCLLHLYDFSWIVNFLYGVIPLVYWAYGAYTVYGTSVVLSRYILDFVVFLLYVTLPLVSLAVLNRSVRMVENNSYGLYPLYYEMMRPFRRVYYEVMRFRNRRNMFRH